MQYEYSPMQLAEIIDFSFLKEWDTIRIVPEGYNIECDCSGCDCGMECKPECATNS